MEGFFAQAIIYILAAIICVSIAKKLGMSSVLGYLLAGILIGPYVFKFISNESEGQDIMHGTEFGVVMMLFLIGLELEPKNLWKMRDLILRVGLAQVLLTSGVIFLLGLVLGVSWNISLTAALSISLSSTAIVLQSLKEKNQMDSIEGKMSFGVLLLQDIAVIPILAILPLLALNAPELMEGGNHGGFFDPYPGWIQTLAIFAAIGLAILMSRYAFGPLLKLVVKTHLRELFVATALLIVVGIAYLMILVGLSPALGAFLAGVVLANSPYKHALESDLEPFKGILLGLFFIAVGSTINFSLISSEPTKIFGLTLGVMLVKALILLGIGKFRKLSLPENLNFAFGLAQASEFSFVTYSFAFQLAILTRADADTLMAVTALSMALSPVLMLILDKTIIQREGMAEKKKGGESDLINEKNQVILLGFGNFGSTVGRFLRANGVEATIMDSDPDQVDFLRQMGFKVYFGDGTRIDLLHAAGAEQAKILISAIDSTEHSIKIIKLCREHFPHLEVMIRARNRFDAYELLDEGVDNIYREHLDTSIRMGEDALKKLGFRAHTVHRLGKQFRDYDEQALKVLVQFKNNRKEYISKVRKQIEMQESLLSGELSRKFSLNDHAWDSEQMKDQNS
ncbi:MAG: monovalent cation:proton antiporter-2 (CPA2) family protein [Algoriphagus aquaeductus]|uniref:Kef-type potassium/proton antiporter (CPA2 family) n=3 Tax=Algoriphagus TaxID=246875 RepID=A0A326RQ99_9BACT|nr:monovalent cation:proton antiporter-2 (CPA2) family protein [Algoriphagus aquaeductus]PZV83779.1 Kef-type potassium/proton antiporter (CPA2 family) [Algoriphagus aquaeductus]